RRSAMVIVHKGLLLWDTTAKSLAGARLAQLRTTAAITETSRNDTPSPSSQNRNMALIVLEPEDSLNGKKGHVPMGTTRSRSYDCRYTIVDLDRFAQWTKRQSTIVNRKCLCCINRHVSIGQHDVGFADHAQQPIL